MQLEINTELQSLIPPLSADEYSRLEKSIVAEGCRDAIVVWNGLIVDGHNRYEICTRHGITFKTVETDFISKQDAMVWMIDNQLSRRNLPDFCKCELVAKKKEILLAAGVEKKKEAGGDKKSDDYKISLVSIFDTSDIAKETHSTREVIAKDLDWSTGKVAMAEVVMKKADEGTKEKLRKAEISINQAYVEIKKAEKVQQREAEIEEVKQKITTQTFNGLYDVIAIDPPWPYGRKFDPEMSRAANPYPEMPLEEIAAIVLPTAENAVIFLWATHAFLQDAFGLLATWNLDYKATLVWDKEKMGMGATVRMQCEFCLLAIKGGPLLQGKSIRDIIREPRREHSRKPDAFYTLVEKLAIGRKLDYFSRQKREGWDSYGAETGKF